MPDKTSIEITKDDEDHVKSFGTIAFSEPGTYKYVVSETHRGETVDGVVYDAEAHKVTITVKDDGKGNLVAADGTELVQTAEF